MTTTQLLALVAGLALMCFIVFAFRQGMRVKPDDRPDRGPSVGTTDGGAPD